ncbi:MAG: N-acetyltransferase, partial [Clostridium perfringens]|nr:N-acetyltransferase [Clostridium perfringens]
DIANSFYKKLGFKEFECLPTLWDQWNPCQIYIMPIN